MVTIMKNLTLPFRKVQMDEDVKHIKVKKMVEEKLNFGLSCYFLLTSGY